jgi:hypothetical protein
MIVIPKLVGVCSKPTVGCPFFPNEKRVALANAPLWFWFFLAKKTLHPTPEIRSLNHFRAVKFFPLIGV